MQNPQVKRETIQKNIVKRNALTPAQQIKELDARLGVGVGAKKERERLSGLLAK